MRALGSAVLFELMPSGAVLLHELSGKGAVLDFGEQLFHLRACLVGHDARAGGVVAELGSVGDGIAHVAEAAAVHQVDDELEFVQALKVGDLRLVAGLDEGFEAGFDQGDGAAAQDGLLAEEIGFGFFGEGGFQNAGAGAADAFGVGERELWAVPVASCWTAMRPGTPPPSVKTLADAMAGGLGGDQGDVNVRRRLDGAEADVEAVREEKELAFGQMRRDVL